MKDNEQRSGNRRGGRLKGVRRRKRARRVYECEVMAWKMRLVKIKSRDDEG